MKVKILVTIVVMMSYALSCIGYAAVSDTLEISGEIEADPPEALFITDVKNVNGSTTAPTYEILPYTSVQSSITLGSSGDSAVTMEITVKNNTDVRYGYNAIRYSTAAYDNPNITVETDMSRKTVDKNGNVISEGTVVEPGESFTFTATFKHKDENAAELALNSLINYEFLPYDSISADVDAGLAKDVMGHFEDILNNIVKIDGTEIMSKDYLDNQMTEDTQGRDDTYIANFTGAKAADKEALAALFGENLTMLIDGSEVTVQLIVKREDVTGDGVDDYTLYMTTHSLLREDAEVEGSWFNRTYYASPVYAAVFQVNDNSEWNMIGEVYAGRGEINSYSGWSGEGSFDTRTWESARAYGTAGVGSSIEQVIAQNTD